VAADKDRPRSTEEPLAELDAESLPEPELTPEQVVTGAVRGSVLIMARTLGGQLIGFLASIVIARLVAPAEFGQFFLAAAIQQAGVAVIFLGLPSSLIQQPESPTPRQQHAVAGFTMAFALAGAAIPALLAFAVLPALGERSTTAEVVAISCVALPIFAARVIPMALLRRRLRYERLLTAEITAQVSFHAAAIPAAAAGLGAFGLAAAVPISALTSTIVIARLQPWDRGFSLDLPVIRRMAAFGGGVSAVRLLTSVQEVGLVSVFAGLGGDALAGFYGMSRRILSLPWGAVRSVQSVGFPALARLEEEELRLRHAAKATTISATVVGFLVAALVGGGEPLIATLFGDRWAPTVDIVTLSAAGLVLFASTGGLASSLALAAGDSRTPLVAVIVQIAATLLIAVAAVPSLDAAGAGLAVGGGYVVFTVALLLGDTPVEMRRTVPSVLRALLIAALAAAAGWLLPVENDLLGAVAGVAVSSAAWLLLSSLLMREELKLLVSLMRTHLLGGWASRRKA
jgi:O-antigen/teichoic acid export membrane protein